jgi:hypothetical protein
MNWEWQSLCLARSDEAEFLLANSDTRGDLLLNHAVDRDDFRPCRLACPRCILELKIRILLLSKTTVGLVSKPCL